MTLEEAHRIRATFENRKDWKPEDIHLFNECCDVISRSLQPYTIETYHSPISFLRGREKEEMELEREEQRHHNQVQHKDPRLD